MFIECALNAFLGKVFDTLRLCNPQHLYVHGNYLNYDDTVG